MHNTLLQFSVETVNRLTNQKQSNRVLVVAAVMVVVTEIALFNEGIVGVDLEVNVVVNFIGAEVVAAGITVDVDSNDVANE